MGPSRKPKDVWSSPKLYKVGEGPAQPKLATLYQGACSKSTFGGPSPGKCPPHTESSSGTPTPQQGSGRPNAFDAQRRRAEGGNIFREKVDQRWTLMMPFGAIQILRYVCVGCAAACSVLPQSDSGKLFEKSTFGGPSPGKCPSGRTDLKPGLGLVGVAWVWAKLALSIKRATSPSRPRRLDSGA